MSLGTVDNTVRQWPARIIQPRQRRRKTTATQAGSSYHPHLVAHVHAGILGQDERVYTLSVTRFVTIPDNVEYRSATPGYKA